MRILSDNGATLTVEGADGQPREVLKGMFGQTFPGAQPEPPPEPAPVPEAPIAPALSSEPSTPGLGMAPDAAPEAPIPNAPFGQVADEPAPTPAPEIKAGPPDATAPPEPANRQAQQPRAKAPTIDESAQQYQSAYDKQQAGIADQAKAEERELALTGQLLSEQDEKLTDIEDRRQEARNKAEALADTKWKDVVSAREEFENSTIDRGRLFSNMSVGKKIALAISAAISTVGQARSRKGAQGGSDFLNLIETAIDKDVADQREQRAHLKNVADQKKTIYDEMRERMGNDDEAAQMNKAIVLGQYARRLKIIANNSARERVQGAAMEKAGQLEERQAQILNGLGEQQRAEFHRQEQLKISKSQAALGWANLKFKKQQAEDEAKKAEAAAKVAASKNALINPATGEAFGAMREGFKIEDAQGSVTANAQFRKEITELAQMVADAKRANSLTAPETIALIEAKRNRIAMAAAKATSGAGASDDEFKRQLDLVPGAQAFTSRTDPTKLYDQLIRDTDEGHKMYLRSVMVPDGSAPQRVESYFQNLDEVHRPGNYAGIRDSPGAIAFSQISKAKTRGQLVDGLVNIAAQAHRKPDSVVGLDKVQQVEQAAAKVINDKNASNKERAQALAAREAVRKSQARALKEQKNLDAQKTQREDSNRRFRQGAGLEAREIPYSDIVD